MVIKGKQEGRESGGLLGIVGRPNHAGTRMARSIIGPTTSERLSLPIVSQISPFSSAIAFLDVCTVLLMLSYHTQLRKLRAGTAEIKYVQLQKTCRVATYCQSRVGGWFSSPLSLVIIDHTLCQRDRASAGAGSAPPPLPRDSGVLVTDCCMHC